MPRRAADPAARPAPVQDGALWAPDPPLLHPAAALTPLAPGGHLAPGEHCAPREEGAAEFSLPPRHWIEDGRDWSPRPAPPRPAPPRPALPYQAPCPAPQGAARGRGLTARPPCRPSQQQHLDAPRVPSAEGHRGASLCKPSASVASVSDAVRPATLFSPPLSLPRQLLPPQRGPSRHVPRLGSRRATRTRVSAQMRARWTPWPSLWRSGEPLRDALAFGSLPF